MSETREFNVEVVNIQSYLKDGRDTISVWTKGDGAAIALTTDLDSPDLPASIKLHDTWKITIEPILARVRGEQTETT